MSVNIYKKTLRDPAYSVWVDVDNPELTWTILTSQGDARVHTMSKRAIVLVVNRHVRLQRQGRTGADEPIHLFLIVAFSMPDPRGQHSIRVTLSYDGEDDEEEEN